MKTKAVAVYTIGILIFSLGLLTQAAPSRAAAGSYAAQVRTYPLFPQRIEWIGPSEPAESESAELLRAMQTFGDGGPTALEHFVAAHPQSAWTPSVRAGLADYYRRQGRFTLSLAHYDAAWRVAKICTDLAGRRLAVRIAGEFAPLLADLSQKDKLVELLNEQEQSKIALGEYSTPVNAARAKLQTMKSYPGDAYKCGLVALNDLAGVLHIDSPLKRYLTNTASPDGGFTIAELLLMARTNGIPVEAVRRPDGAELVVPCIMHWKFNHYALVTAASDGRYQVAAQVSGSSIYMTASAIGAESSGVFLVPADKVPAAWQKLSPTECARIRGGCYGALSSDDDDDNRPDCCFTEEGCPPNDPPDANDGASGDGSDNDPCGMVVWSVSEPYINLWLRDIPLRYHLSSGNWMSLQLSYKQRNVATQNYKDYICSFGRNWECSWIGMIEVSGGNYFNHLAGGGVTEFNVGTPDYKSGRILSVIESVPIISSSRGSTNYYEFSYPFAGGEYRFLTRQEDRYGRCVEYHYTNDNGVVKLTSVTDRDGRTITLAYDDAEHPNFITSVSDPYYRTCRFEYDDQADYGKGLLTNIVDTIEMSSSFQYDGNNLITNLTTPYGQTTFQSADYSSDRRVLLVTEANGDHQLYAFCASQSFADYPIGDTESSYRNSYHWDRAQYITAHIQDYIGTPLSAYMLYQLPASAYYMASIKHWLHNSTYGGNAPVSDTLGAMAGPLDDPSQSPSADNVRSGAVSYGYYGQSRYDHNSGCGTRKWVTAVGNADFSTTYLSIQRNSLGRPTMFTHYNSDGSTVPYYNFYDASGMCLQSQFEPHAVGMRYYNYNNPAHPNLLTAVGIGPNCEAIFYTHDPVTLKVTSITFPNGLVRTNIYYADGPSKGFLQIQADLGIRTNYFTYENGNVCIQTNELGLVTSNTWDNLNRLISTAYPDGTTISNVYEKLDLVGTKDRLEQWTRYLYDPVRQLLWETNVNDQVTHYDYCGCGSPALITRWLNGQEINTTFAYDIAGRLTNTAYADGYEINRTYDANDQLQTISDTSGRQVRLTYARHTLRYDLNSASMISGTSPFLLLTNRFDQYGRVTNSVDRNAVTVTYGYDYANRLNSRQTFGNSGTQESGLERFEYFWAGSYCGDPMRFRFTFYYDPLNQLTTFVHDAAGRVLYETNANLEVLKFTYNPADELLSLTDGKDQNTYWNYDQYGRVTNKVDDYGVEMFRYYYDPNDRLTNRWQAGDITTTYRYDPIGNLTNVIYSGGTSYTSPISYRYDGLNRLTNMVDNIGSTAFTWTDGDQLAGETGPWPSDAVSYTYNNRLRDTLTLAQPGMADWSQTYQYDEFFRLTNVTSFAGMFGYQYAARTAPGGAATVSDLIQKLTCPNNSYSQRGYDDLGRLMLIELTDGSGVYDLHAYEYDLASQRTQQTFAAGNYVNYAYDNIGQLKTAQGYEIGGLPRPQEQFGYKYDAAWNLSQRTNNTLVQTFVVNSLNELTVASRPPDSSITVAGLYEGANPPVTVTVSGTGMSEETAMMYADGTWAVTGVTPEDGANTYTAAASDSSGQYAQDTVNVYLPESVLYQYDGRGNLTSDGRRNFSYDAENQLKGVWVANSWSNCFVYDGLMRKRIERDYAWSSALGNWQCTNRVRFVYDGMLVLQERGGTNYLPSANVPRVTYTRGNDLSGTLQEAGGIGGLLARTDMQLSTSSYYHADGNGNVTCLIDTNNMVQARYNYDPFGNLLAMSGPLADANKYRFSSKEWNNSAGLYYYGYRFYDPNLQRWLNRDPIDEWGGINLYGFVNNSPIFTADPLGLWPAYCHNKNLMDTFGKNESPEIQKAMEKANYDMDFGPGAQDPANSYQHGMRDPKQSSSDAKAEADKFIADQLQKAIQAQKEGGHKKAMEELTRGAHTIADRFSPSHHGEKVWPGNGITHWPGDAVHVLREMHESKKTRKAIDNALNDYYKQFQAGCGE